MNIPERWMKTLSAQERTVLFLGDALHILLDNLQSGYVPAKVDVAFSSDKGLVIYSYNNGYEVNQFLVNPEGVQHFVYSPGQENPGNNALLTGATKEDINRIFRRWEPDEHEEDPRTMLSKVEYAGWFDENTKVYCVVIGYRDGVQNKEIIQHLFSELIDSIKDQITRKDMELLTEIRPQLAALEITRNAAVRILANRFYDDDKDVRGIDLYETLCLLSCAPYEKSQNRGRIGIFNPSIGKSKAYVRFVKTIELSRKNVREIRKLLELSDRKNTILIANDGKLIGVYSTSDNKGKYAGTGILFRGYGKWDLFSDKVGSIIAFDSVTIRLANQSIDLRIRKGFEYAGMIHYNEARITRIVKCARKQSHGTTIIVSEAAVQESERLAEANRAIRIDPIQVDEKTILSLSAIDGAIIIDTNGVCYAIGAILDGVAEKAGNIARGARYNSAVTYVDYEASKGNKTVAMIISSDDTVDIYPDKMLQALNTFSIG